MKVKLTGFGLDELEVDIKDSDRDICKEPSCRAEIYWIWGRSGRRVPIHKKEDGTWVNHFSDCTKPERFGQSSNNN